MIGFVVPENFLASGPVMTTKMEELLSSASDYWNWYAMSSHGVTIIISLLQ